MRRKGLAVLVQVIAHSAKEPEDVAHPIKKPDASDLLYLSAPLSPAEPCLAAVSLAHSNRYSGGARVATLQAEALVLRTWPVHEADEIVSLFTRNYGRIRGVANAAAKSRRRFGGALEPMTWVSASYAERPKQDLVRLDSCEVIASPLSDPIDYIRASALAFYAEVLEEAMPDHDPHEAAFRLVLAVLQHTRDNCVWMPVTYFSLWIIRLLGWMPSLTQCTVCGDAFGAGSAWFQPESDGLLCVHHKRLSSRILAPESLTLARRIFQSPIAALSAEDWPPTRATDLRRFAIQSLERHLERRLLSAAALNKLGQ
jgi:DNA repair protein RecO (recombination protein O)